MKNLHKYLHTPLIYLLVFLAVAIPYLLAGYIVDGVFALLCESLPDIFTRRDVITSPAEYAEQIKALTVIKAVLALLAVAYISVLADNRRCEHLISLTDGRYTISEGLGIYYRAFWLSDILSGILPPVLLAIPAALIPERILKYGLDSLLRPLLDFSGAFGIANGTIVLILISVAMRFLSAVPAVMRWRVSWLSGSL